MTPKARNARYQRSGYPHRSSRAISAILIAVVLLVAVVAVFSVIYFSPPEVDVRTGCPDFAGHVKRNVYILLDTTDKVSGTQKANIENVILGVVQALDPYSRVSIFEILPSRDQRLTPIFDYCKPDADDPLGSPVVQLFDKQRFRKRLNTSLGRLAGGSLPSSPIIYSLGSVATHFASAEGKITLIIASDFIEHSDLINQYSSRWPREERKNRKKLRDSAPNLSGAEISMLFIIRSEVRHHNPRFSNWWREYLSKSKGKLVDQTFTNEVTGETYHLFPFIPITE